MKSKIFDLTESEKAKILDNFILRIEHINEEQGTILGSYQVLRMIEQVAIDGGLIECPHCHRKVHYDR